MSASLDLRLRHLRLFPSPSLTFAAASTSLAAAFSSELRGLRGMACGAMISMIYVALSSELRGLGGMATVEHASP